MNKNGDMNHQLVEIASWSIVSELHRRYPDKFKIIETHPGGGQYDCLTLYDIQRQSSAAHFNRQGRFSVFQRFDLISDLPEPLDIWPLMMTTSGSKEILDRVSSMLGLPIPSHLPPSTPVTLVYRVIAAFLKHAAFGLHRWECRNGIFDTSGMEEGGRVEAFEKFPLARERLQADLPDDILREPAYRFWFVYRDYKPVLCLETTGLVWTLDEREIHLAQLYAEYRRIWPLIAAIAGDLLP